jgi:ABC-type phosphate transport system substrate-binding protein
VQGTQYTIGYVELAYALQNSMTVAAIQNAASVWKLPTLSSTAAAAAGASALPAGNGNWAAVNLLNEPGTNAYPIVTFSYILVFQDLSVVNGQTLAKATALVNFLWWEVGATAQATASGLSYCPLPANVVALDEATIKSITFNGQPISITATQ